MNLLHQPIAPPAEIQARLAKNRLEAKYLQALWKLSIRAMHDGAHEALIVDKTTKAEHEGDDK